MIYPATNFVNIIILKPWRFLAQRFEKTLIKKRGLEFTPDAVPKTASKEMNCFQAIAVRAMHDES
ncbi:hypothetical protein CKO12_08045 [Chromatium okenii]|uniref:hypothetical protein n=1 Tax=Chromatium okenii TaxID=61644 RepID=UPI001908A0EF|nr:hypothetical protein [Chromatium okenii]MBK1641819.1 hypothetical protein [Chromatium okenii]